MSDYEESVCGALIIIHMHYHLQQEKNRFVFESTLRLIYIAWHFKLQNKCGWAHYKERTTYKAISHESVYKTKTLLRTHRSILSCYKPKLYYYYRWMHLTQQEPEQKNPFIISCIIIAHIKKE